MPFIIAVISLFFAILVLYPYTIYPLILKMLPMAPSVICGSQESDGNRTSLLFCAFNEEKSIKEKIRNIIMLRERYPNMEFLAFDDGSTDGTAGIIEAEASFIKLFKGKGRNGKAYGMKVLAEESRKEYLIFTDANVTLHLNAPQVVASVYSDNSIGGICGALRYQSSEVTVTSDVGGLYWRLEERIKDLESSTGSVMGAAGSIFSIRKELYPEFPNTVLDDFTASMSVVFAKKRLIKCNDVIAYENLVTSRGDEFTRKVRIAARAYHTHNFLRHDLSKMAVLDKFKYVSHKFLRWFGAAFAFISLILLFISASLCSIYVLLALTFVMIVFIIIGIFRENSIAAKIIEILISMVATLLGIYKAMKGLTFSTWKPAGSR